MERALIFHDTESFQEWYYLTSNYEKHPTCIKTKKAIKADSYINAKTWEEALNIFESQFEEIPEVTAWIDKMRNSCIKEKFVDTTSWIPEYVVTAAQKKQIANSEGVYMFGVEEFQDDDRWYVYLNISGKYVKGPSSISKLN